MNQKLFKKKFYNQRSHYENYRQFCYKWKPSRAYHKIDMVSKMNGTQRRALVNA